MFFSYDEGEGMNALLAENCLMPPKRGALNRQSVTKALLARKSTVKFKRPGPSALPVLDITDDDKDVLNRPSQDPKRGAWGQKDENVSEEVCKHHGHTASMSSDLASFLDNC